MIQKGDLNILYLIPINLFLISIPLIGKEREIIRILPLLYFIIIFFKRKEIVNKMNYRITILTILYIGVVAILFKNKDLLTYIFIFLINFFLSRYSNRKIIDKLFKCCIIFILLYLLGYILKIFTISKTIYRERIYFLFLGKKIIMDAPFWGNIVYSVVVLTIFKYQNKKSAFISCLLLFIYYKNFDGRGPVISGLILIILFLLKDKKKIRLFIYKVLKLILPFLIAISIFFPIYLKNNKYIDYLMSFRLTFWNKLIEKKGIEGLFLIEPIKSFDYIIDNSYLHVIYGGGVYIGLILIILLQISFLKIAKGKQFLETIFIISFLIYCFLESILLRYEVFATIFFWYIIVKNLIYKGERNNERNYTCRRIRNKTVSSN